MVFLDSEKNWKRRKINEAVYNNSINPTNEVDRKRVLNLEKGSVLYEIWSEFNDVCGQSTSKTKLRMQVDVLIGTFFQLF